MLVLFVEKKAIKQQETKKYNAGGSQSSLGLDVSDNKWEKQ